VDRKVIALALLIWACQSRLRVSLKSDKVLALTRHRFKPPQPKKAPLVRSPAWIFLRCVTRMALLSPPTGNMSRSS
jgi:hypothetical protein